MNGKGQDCGKKRKQEGCRALLDGNAKVQKRSRGSSGWWLSNQRGRISPGRPFAVLVEATQVSEVNGGMKGGPRGETNTKKAEKKKNREEKRYVRGCGKKVLDLRWDQWLKLNAGALTQRLIEDGGGSSTSGGGGDPVASAKVRSRYIEQDPAGKKNGDVSC